MPRIVVFSVAAAALCAGLAAGWWTVRTESGAAPEPDNATVFPAPRPLPDYALTAHTGEAFTPESLRGQWSLLFFGFTNCPDICPLTLVTLARARDELAELPPDSQPQVVMISLDPERDTPQRLAAYVPHYDASFTGVTGPMGELTALTRALGVAWAYVPAGDGDGYSVDHSASVFLVDPDGRQAAIFRAPHEAAALAATYRAIVARAGS